MPLSVRTVDGILVADSPLGSPKGVDFAPEQAQAQADRCNQAAEALGIPTRYVVSED
jgi:hypothetical protein